MLWSAAILTTRWLFQFTQAIDPIGRTTNHTYANQIDLTLSARRLNLAFSKPSRSTFHNTRHRPVIYTDASGQITTYTYNNAGQLTGHEPSRREDELSIQRVQPADRGYQRQQCDRKGSNNHDTERIRTFTDSEGWIATCDYDAADRLTKIAYPDGTSDQYAYDKLPPLISHLIVTVKAASGLYIVTMPIGD